MGAVLGAVAGLAVTEADRHLNVPGYFQYSSSTASTVLSAIVGAAVALTGFVVTVTTLIVQMVNGTYGASGIQAMRALRAMLEELCEHVRPEHRAAVGEELARLDSTLTAHWGNTVDLDRAMVADGQGIGGAGLAGKVSR
jgi:hypothetical protein